MISGLQLLSQFLGYFNIKDKPKNRAITVIAFIVNFYLLYVSIENLKYPGYFWHGVAYFLAFIILEYFLFLNFVYYFTDKTVRFDISPYIEKLLGGNPNEVENENVENYNSIPSSGIFDSLQNVMPINLNINGMYQNNINKLAKELEIKGYLKLDYEGLSKHDLYNKIIKNHSKIMAIGKPLQIPFYELKEDVQSHSLYIYGGVNSLNSKCLGKIVSIGFTPIEEARIKYKIALSNVYISGGPCKYSGRKGVIVENKSFTIKAYAAYEPKDKISSSIDHRDDILHF